MAYGKKLIVNCKTGKKTLVEMSSKERELRDKERLSAEKQAQSAQTIDDKLDSLVAMLTQKKILSADDAKVFVKAKK